MLYRSLFAAILLLVPSVLAQEEGDVPLPRPRPEPAVTAPAAPEAAEAAEEAEADVPDASEAAAGDADESSAEATEAEAPPTATTEEGTVIALPRPRPEPEPEPEAADVDEAPPATGDSEDGDAAEGVPDPEPEAPPRIYQSACPAVISGAVIARSLPPIAEGACGEQSPLEVTGVMANGQLVEFSSPATLSCAMATALPEWIAEIDRYAEARENSGVSEVLTGTSYMCRNVNNGSTGNLSFHAFANALDVTGFVLEDGQRMTLPSGWADAGSAEGRLLRFAHSAACARFTTTLGPEANALHEDHLHVDMGCHGGRCLARLCE
ncbi:extensin family protein [Devosia enhydra]|nr:extensin family protein [Devosia enhydra]